MYTSSKRGYVNAFASRLLRVVSETLLPGSDMQQLGMIESLDQQQQGV